MQIQQLRAYWKALVLAGCFCFPVSVNAGPTATVDSFHVAAAFTSKGGIVNGQNVASTTIQYRLYVPKNYNPAIRYPIMLTLHGAGEAGSDNRIQLTAYRFTVMWADDTLQAKQPMFVLAPQCPGPAYTVTWFPIPSTTAASWNYNTITQGSPIQAVVELYDSLLKAYSIDTTRQYVSGLSMGGYATWYLLCRFPTRWSAAVPDADMGDTSRSRLNTFLTTPRYSPVSIWDFHGSADPTVTVTASRVMFASLNAAYRTLSMDTTGRLRYTEYAGVGHNSWVNASNDPRLMPWVIAQQLIVGPVGIISHRDFRKPLDSWSSFPVVKAVDVLGRKAKSPSVDIPFIVVKP